MSEKLSDVIDPKIKYGGGPELWRHVLGRVAEAVASYEGAETELAVAEMSSLAGNEVLENLRHRMSDLRNEIVVVLQDAIARLDALEEREP
jgi:hypothetical protein